MLFGQVKVIQDPGNDVRRQIIPATFNHRVRLPYFEDCVIRAETQVAKGKKTDKFDGPVVVIGLCQADEDSKEG